MKLSLQIGGKATEFCYFAPERAEKLVHKGDGVKAKSLILYDVYLQIYL